MYDNILSILTANDTKNQIIEVVSSLGKATVTDVLKNLSEPKSRQWVSLLLTQLAKEKILVSSRSGRYVIYVLPENIDLIGNKISRRLVNQNLDEDIVFVEESQKTFFIKSLKKDVKSILSYAFTEMLNNAIEHSKSETIEVFFEKSDDKIIFEIRDKGVGSFRNIQQKKGLKSELEAIQELLKGKTTTLPHSHSGEGIFFTSKIADLFILDSYGYRLRVDNKINDLFIEEPDSIEGTRVRFEIDENTNKHLEDIFKEYQAEPESHAFDKTKVHVKLFKAGTVYISRSQARRLMVNLQKFRLIVLDFEGIETVGQAFADEVFRVFASKNPGVKIYPINMIEIVQFMIDRVQKP